MRLRTNQDGWAVVTAVILMSIMLTIALGAIAFVDTETNSSRRERTHETRLNLTEGVVAAELYRLSRTWPNAQPAIPDQGLTCTQTSTNPLCPTPSQVLAQFSGADFKFSPAWKVQVRDDTAPLAAGSTCSVQPAPGFYSDSAVLGQPNWDANKNCQLWVRAEGTLQGKKRVVVAKVRVENRAPTFPQAPFVAGSFGTSNNGGSKTIVDGSGFQGTVRCASGPSCASWTGQQLTNPASVSMGDPNIGSTALDPSMIEALRAIAKKNNTWYQDCSSANPNGDVVFVESGSCQFNASTPVVSGAVNGGTKKGIFVLANGTIKMTGNLIWYGYILAANGQNTSSTVVDIGGTGTIYGGVFVDGNGNLTVGSSGNAGNGNLPNIVYKSDVLPDVTAYGTAGIIQNTWRELTAG
jgi:hypothetical protein